MQAVKRLRKRRGWTIEELATAASVSHFTISEIELGKRNPHGRTLKKIASALDVQVADLFDDEASIPKEKTPEAAPTAAAGALNEAPGRLELLESHTSRILAMVEELDPDHESLDRVAMTFLEDWLSKVSRLITEKKRSDMPDKADNPLTSPLQETLDAEGVEVSSYLAKPEPVKAQFRWIPDEAATDVASETEREKRV